MSPRLLGAPRPRVSLHPPVTPRPAHSVTPGSAHAVTPGHAHSPTPGPARFVTPGPRARHPTTPLPRPSPTVGNPAASAASRSTDLSISGVNFPVNVLRWLTW